MSPELTIRVYGEKSVVNVSLLEGEDSSSLLPYTGKIANLKRAINKTPWKNPGREEAIKEAVAKILKEENIEDFMQAYKKRKEIAIEF